MLNLAGLESDSRTKFGDVGHSHLLTLLYFVDGVQLDVLNDQVLGE